jgi:hypothetical protein
MKAGFREKQRTKRNRNGNINYGTRDQQLAAKLIAKDLDENWADEHVQKAISEIQATWSEAERERRDWSKQSGITMPQIIVHHHAGAVFHRTMVE